MKNKKPNAEHIWKQFEDHLVPRLRLSITDRAVYSHLLRHSRLEGRTRLRFSIVWLARGARLSTNPARWAVRRLIAHGALRLVERGKAGHVVEVRLPDEIRACSPRRATRHKKIGRRCARPFPRSMDFEEDFLKSRALRHAIHVRERGRCFYCLRRLTPMIRCLDHVVPRVSFGSNSYRNLVSCCLQCNSQKRDRSAGDFLRWLYRERRLTAPELTARLRALDALASGKLPPRLPCLTGKQAAPAKPAAY
jgi:5-methylcytosine-specific restriction endonuclease McrA